MPDTIRSARHELLIKRIVEARKKAGLTQAELAAQFGKHQPFIANIESGQRRVDLVELVAIADSIGLDLHKLINDLRRLPAGVGQR